MFLSFTVSKTNGFRKRLLCLNKIKQYLVNVALIKESVFIVAETSTVQQMGIP